MHAYTFRLNWKWMILAGSLLVIVGLVAISLPQMFSKGLDEVLAAVLITSGAIHFYNALKLHRPRGLLLSAPAAILQCGLGAWILFRSDQDTGILILLLTLLIAFEGLFKTYWAFQIRPDENWKWLAGSAGISLILAGLLAIGIFGTDYATIGLLVGINLLTTGATLLLVGVSSYAPGASKEAEVEVPVPTFGENGDEQGEG